MAGDSQKEDKAAAEKLVAAADVAAGVKLAAETTAAKVRENEAHLAAEIRKDTRDAAEDARRLEFYKIFVLPLLLALIVAVPATIPGCVAAWRSGVNAEAIREMKDVAVETHELVNSGSLVQLKTNVRSAKRLAELSGDPEDLRDLEEAERLVAAHIAKEKKAEATKDES